MILFCVGGECRVEAPEIEFECGGRSPRSRPALVAAWNSANRRVTPGAFVGAVDLARSWKRGTLRAMDILATDEREQTRVLTASGRMTFAGPTKRISPIWRAAPSRGAVRRRNARCSISPVTRWPIWLWHRSSTRQRCGKAWVRGWRAELTVCFGSMAGTECRALQPGQIWALVFQGPYWGIGYKSSLYLGSD